VVQAMDSLARVLGIPDECQSTKQGQVEASTIELAFQEIARAIADECEQKLAELAVTLLEDPNYRLAGAEEALRQIGATVEQAFKHKDTLAKELAYKSEQLQQRLQKLTEPSRPTAEPTSSQRTLVAKPAGAGAVTLSAGAIFELVRTYAKTRYHSIVLIHLDH